MQFMLSALDFIGVVSLVLCASLLVYTIVEIVKGR